MSVALDQSTPAAQYGSADTYRSTLTPPAGSMLIAACIGDFAATFDVSDSSGLTWTQIDGITNRGGLALFWAYTENGGRLTVSSTRNDPYPAHYFQVCVFTGTETSFTGAHGAANDHLFGYTATADGSMGIGVLGFDNIPPASYHLITGCEWVSNNGDNRLSGYGGGGALCRSSADGLAGRTTLLGTNHTGTSVICVAEIKPATITSTPATVSGPATRLTASAAAGVVAAGAVLAGPSVQAQAHTPAGTVTAGTSIPATVTGPPTILTGSTPAGQINAPATLNGTPVRLTANTPAGTVQAGQRELRRDITVTLGPPALDYAVRTPAGNPDTVSAPTGNPDTAAPPSLGAWSVSAPYVQE